MSFFQYIKNIINIFIYKYIYKNDIDSQNGLIIEQKYTIYCLELENNKYYVGRTLDYKKRIKAHFKGNGCAWTMKYKPLKVYGIRHNCDAFDEDKWVKILMMRHGIMNIRGGSYSCLNLNTYVLYVLENEINGAMDICFFM